MYFIFILCVEVLVLNMTKFGNMVFKEVIKVKWGHKGRALLDWTDSLFYEDDWFYFDLSLHVCTTVGDDRGHKEYWSPEA